MSKRSAKHGFANGVLNSYKNINRSITAFGMTYRICKEENNGKDKRQLFKAAR